MRIVKNPEVAEVFNQYPKNIRQKLLALRELIMKTASEIEGIEEIEETLKWGEPSYIVKGGSTVRIDWKNSNPDQYAMYFHCKTKLVDTFKEIYGNDLRFDGNRAIIIENNEVIPTDKLKHCVELSFTYHSRKHLPMLGI